MKRRSTACKTVVSEQRGSTLLLAATLFVGFVAVLPIAAQSVPAPPVQGVSAPDPAEIVGQPAGKPLKGEALEIETRRVASLLRCPVCQGLSVFDSPAEMARNMKTEVRDLLARGYSDEQVLRYFETSYGEFVRLQPPLRGMNWLVWILPVATLAAGAMLVRARLRSAARRTAAAATETSTSDESTADLVPYLESVRRIVDEPRSVAPAAAESSKQR